MSTNQSSWPDSGQILRHQYWNFCRWDADFPLGQTSLMARSKEKRLYSQAKLNAAWNNYGEGGDEI